MAVCIRIDSRAFPLHSNPAWNSTVPNRGKYADYKALYSMAKGGVMSVNCLSRKESIGEDSLKRSES